MVVYTENIERLINGPVDVTWPIFLHVAPILAQFLKTGGREVITIDDVLSKNGTNGRRGARERRAQVEYDIAMVLDAYLVAAVPHMHAMSCAFDNYFKPNIAQTRPFDFHKAVNQGEFYKTLAKHLSKIMKLSHVSSHVTREEIDNVVNHFTRKRVTGFTVDDRHAHIVLKHGSLAIDSSSSYSLVAEVSRIKYPARWAAKIARTMCLGLMELHYIEKFRGSQHPMQLQKEVRETFGEMNDFGLATPFGEGGLYTTLPNPMEYLFIRSCVSDAVGVFFITRAKEEVFALLQQIIQGKFSGAGYYHILKGSVLLKKDGQWKYICQPVIDNHFETGSLEGTGGNKNLFFYVEPKYSHPKFKIKVDVGISDLYEYVHDCPPNKGSHTIFEQRQQQRIRSLPRAYQTLFASLSDAVRSIMNQLDIYSYPLTSHRIANGRAQYNYQRSIPEASAITEVS